MGLCLTAQQGVIGVDSIELPELGPAERLWLQAWEQF